jgi:hypothetical protein
MTYHIGSTKVINLDSAYIHESFPQNVTGVSVKITASDGASSDNFGYSVAVECGRIVVGASGRTTSSGAAYIFNLDGNELAEMTPSDGSANDYFGTSVSVGSGRIVVGAWGDDDKGSLSGSAYIFDLDGNQLIKITASDGAADDRFGYSAAVGCGRIVVGAYGDDIGANADQGSSYIFDLDGNQLAKITASDGAASDFFGYSVAVGCGRIVVGAYGDNTQSGSAYIFDLDGNQLTKITASDGASGDFFGYSVAVGSGRIVVGAYGDDIGANSNQGSSYIFDLDGNQLAKITASDGAANDHFGRSVAVGCSRIVVGASVDDIGANSDQGSAYIFDLNQNQLSKLTAYDGATNDFFGYSVAVGCGRIVVGAWGDDIGASSDRGSSYMYNTPEDSNTYWERVLETYKY